MNESDPAGRERRSRRLEQLLDEVGEVGGWRPDVCAVCAAERAAELALLERIQAGLRSVQIPRALRQRILASLGAETMDDYLRGH